MSGALAVVLAAGKGTRMESDLPKVLVRACGRPLVDYVLDTLSEAGVTRTIVVIGYRGDDVREAMADRPSTIFVEQTQQLGTGHAVQVCRDQLLDFEGPVLVVTGDSPMLQVSSLESLLTEFHRQQPACILGTLEKEDPSGLGRIVRHADGGFQGIVEHKDASPPQLKIREVNMSTYVFDCQQLVWALGQLQNDNQQGEFYITDCPGILKSAGQLVLALPVLKECEALSVNDLADLASVEAEMIRIKSGD